MRARFFFPVLALLAVASAHAADPELVSLDDLLKKRGSATAMVVVVARDDAELAKSVTKLLPDPKLAKVTKDDVVWSRMDPADEGSATRLGIPAEKAECVLTFDGYGVPVAKHVKAVTADTLVTLVKQAQDATAKKKKLEKKLDQAVERGEAAFKKSDWKTACEQFLSVVDYKKTLPCPAVATAEKRLEDLKGKAEAMLTDAREATHKNDFPKAHKLLNDVKNSFPIPSVLEDMKAAGNELGAAENHAQGK